MKNIKEIMLEKTHIRDTLSREEVIDETLAEVRRRLDEINLVEIFSANPDIYLHRYRKKLDKVLR